LNLWDVRRVELSCAVLCLCACVAGASPGAEADGTLLQQSNIHAWYEKELDRHEIDELLRAEARLAATGKEEDRRIVREMRTEIGIDAVDADDAIDALVRDVFTNEKSAQILVSKGELAARRIEHHLKTADDALASELRDILKRICDTRREVHVVVCQQDYTSLLPYAGTANRRDLIMDPVNVVVDRPGRPVVLCLNGLNAMRWEVTATEGTWLEKVVLGGDNAQRLVNNPGCPVISRTYSADSDEYLYFKGPYSAQTRRSKSILSTEANGVAVTNVHSYIKRDEPVAVTIAEPTTTATQRKNDIAYRYTLKLESALRLCHEVQRGAGKLTSDRESDCLKLGALVRARKEDRQRSAESLLAMLGSDRSPDRWKARDQLIALGLRSEDALLRAIEDGEHPAEDVCRQILGLIRAPHQVVFLARVRAEHAKTHDGPIKVNVDAFGKRVNIVLICDEPRSFVFDVEPGSMVQNVILGGRSRSSVDGLPPSVKIIDLTRARHAGQERDAMLRGQWLDDLVNRLDWVEKQVGIPLAGFTELEGAERGLLEIRADR